MKPPTEVIAMHGWASDARCWEAWMNTTQPLGWRWQTGERGYGAFAPRVPTWSDAPAKLRRVVIGHSLGPHLLAPQVLQRADAVVLLASFAAFIPPGRQGRRTKMALAGMTATLAGEGPTRIMLKQFMGKVAHPQSVDLLPPGPVDGPLDEANRMRLREDLALLERCADLPEGFPRGARVLIVEPEADQVVEPVARAMLRAALPEADVIALPGIGHALLAGDVITRVVEWVGSLPESDSR